MGRWAIAVVFWLPFAAHADPSAPSWTPTQPLTPSDTFYHPSPSAGPAPSGWGLRATWRGRSWDLASLDLQGDRDPVLGPKDEEAGLGWRGAASSTLIGYSRHDLGFAAPAANFAFGRGPAWRNPGVIGLSFTLRTR
ncbi:MAG: hypothetical protein ACREEQ_06700 [Caulobacteraceae bacterium]